MDEFRHKEAKRFWHRTKKPESARTAWNGLSPDERSHYTALAKQKEVYNTTELAKFNSRCPLSPSVEALKFTVTMGQYESVAELKFQTRRVTLQRWNEYRFDHARACGGALTPVPETPFRIMDREILVHVLRWVKPVCQFRSDGSADTRGGPIDVRVFAVSRAVFAEAVRAFYEEKTITLKPRDRRYRDHLPLFVSQSARDQAPRPKDSIKRMHINVEVGLAGHTLLPIWTATRSIGSKYVAF